MLNVQQYTPRIPISGGGGYRGNIDLTENLMDNPIVQSLMLMQQLKRQKKQDKQMQGQITVDADGNTMLVDIKTGQVKNLGFKSSAHIQQLLQSLDLARKGEEFKRLKETPVVSPSQQIAQKKNAEMDRLQQKITDGTATANERAMLEKMLAGQPMVQIGLGQPASPTERTKIAETRASIDALNNLKTLFDSAQTKTGPVTGRVSPIAGLVGMTTDEQEAFMAATSAFKNKIIKEITGAQMSEVEAKRIMKQVPDITDPSVRWQAKWEQSRKNLEMLQRRRMQILQQSGIRVPGGDQEITIGGQVEKEVPITATNPQTGERIQSVDGGKTWQPIK